MRNKSLGILGKISSSIHRNKLGELLVIKGLISSSDLRNTLSEQKQTGEQVGQILIKNQMISRWQLSSILGRQMALRCLAAGLLFGASMFNVSSHKAKADTGFTLVSASQEFAKVSSYPALMESAEKRERDLSAFTKWTSMFSRFNREMRNAANARLLGEWQSEINRFQGQSMKQMVSSVNRLVNQKRYILDKNNWGKSDYWATPIEFLKRGGDCEDFAIAKYAALRSLGFPEERLRVAIVQDTKKNIPHAVLVAYTDQGAYLLDNQNKNLIDAEVKGRYKPIFSINRQAWWLHTEPKGTIIASAR